MIPEAKDEAKVARARARARASGAAVGGDVVAGKVEVETKTGMSKLNS